MTSYSPIASTKEPTEPRQGLRERYRTVRTTTEGLCAPLSPEDATVQSMPDASPAKWHLAHTTWFFETLVLEAAATDYRPFNRDFRFLFNSYYNTIGKQHARPERGMITRPGLTEVRDYRRHVDEHLGALLEADALSDFHRDVVELGLHHEQQHQELIVTDLKHLLSRNPLHPSYRDAHPALAAHRDPGPLQWRGFDAGVHAIGYEGGAFAYDNEQPRHRVYLESFQLASRLVTNADYLEFMADGGYRTPELWLSDGWATVSSEGWDAPFYWFDREGQWYGFTLGGLQPINPTAPICHLSYYEADAYARWAGARLPTEAEWEIAAADQPIAGNFVESTILHPVPAAVSDQTVGMVQLFGDVWEWTQTPYSQYPGYRPPDGPLGEYNSKFMCNQLVLRGGSCATPISHIRATYRNFFPPSSRWQFSGIRLARDAQ